MKNTFEKTTNYSFEKTARRLRKKLKKEGFEVFTEIDMGKTLREKFNINLKKYKILQACKPPFTHNSFQLEGKIGIKLPCNIFVQQITKKQTRVAIVNPVSTGQIINNPSMEDLANKIHTKLENVINNL